MGPLSSEVKVQSEFYKFENNLLFKRYRVEVERFGFFENYEIGDGVIYYSNSKGQEMEIRINNKAFQDPLSFLFQMANDGKDIDDFKEIPLLIGKKIETFSSTKINGFLELLKKSKLFVRLKKEFDRLIIEIPKLKLKLNLTKNSSSSAN